MIVVTHLLGSGHLARALTLGAAFRDTGHETLILSGGMPAAHLRNRGLRIVQLPPLRSDGTDFSRLLDEKDQPVTPGLLARRAETAIAALEAFRPEALITELFPFGRRNLRQEFLALLDAAASMTAPPVVFCSIRDILAPPTKPAKIHFAEDLIARRYNTVLVHADRAVTPLDLSWPVSDQLARQLAYTGFVAPAPAPPHPDALGAGEILVTAGGGDVGAPLFACARQAAALRPEQRWRLLVGGAAPQGQIEALRQDAPPNLVVEAARPDFRQMLHHAAASVSFCGYNTALDLLQTACPAVFIPFDAGNEQEQGIRAKALAAQPGIEVLHSADLSADSLLHAVARAQAAPRLPLPAEQTQGAARTVALVAERVLEARNG